MAILLGGTPFTSYTLQFLGDVHGTFKRNNILEHLFYVLHLVTLLMILLTRLRPTSRYIQPQEFVDPSIEFQDVGTTRLS
jgi:hypothetical protein